MLQANIRSEKFIPEFGHHRVMFPTKPNYNVKLNESETFVKCKVYSNDHINIYLWFSLCLTVALTFVVVVYNASAESGCANFPCAYEHHVMMHEKRMTFMLNILFNLLVFSFLCDFLCLVYFRECVYLGVVMVDTRAQIFAFI